MLDYVGLLSAGNEEMVRLRFSSSSKAQEKEWSKREKHHERRDTIYMTQLTGKLIELGQICMESFCCLAAKAGRHTRRGKKEERDVQVFDWLQRDLLTSRSPYSLPRPLRHSQQRSKIRKLMDATIQIPVHSKIIRPGDSACCRASISKLFKMTY